MQLFNVKSLTDTELFEKIDSFCEKVFHPWNSLNEMAFDRKEIMKRLYDETENIFENLGLIKYTSLYGDVYNCRSHWEREFVSACGRVQRGKLKKGNDRDKIYKALAELWYNKEEFNSEEGISIIIGIIHNKFIIENFISNDDTREQKVKVLTPIAEFIYQELDSVLRLIAYSDGFGLTEYIKSI